MTFADIIIGIPRLNAITISALVITTVAFAMRVHVRAVLLRNFGFDDWSMSLCWLLFVACSAVILVFLKQVDDLFVNGRVAQNLETMVNLAVGLYILTLTALKVSLAAFFIKIFVEPYRWQRITVYIIAAITFTLGIAYFLATILTCGLLASFTGSQSCHSAAAWAGVTNAWSVCNAVSDMTFAGLSIMAICNAKLPIGSKLSASALLAIGTLGGAASIIRLIVFSSPHNIEKFVDAASWTVIEMGTGITSACLATLRPLVRSCVERRGRSEKQPTTTAFVTYNTIQGHLVPSAFSPKRQNSTPLRDWRDDCADVDGEEKSPVVVLASLREDIEAENECTLTLQTHNLV